MQDSSNNVTTDFQVSQNVDKTNSHTQRRMQRRQSLTLGFRQQDSARHLCSPRDDSDDSGDDSMQNQGLSETEGAVDQQYLRQLSASSDSMTLDLGDLASLLIPPKIVESERIQRSTSTGSRKKFSRRGSCDF